MEKNVMDQKKKILIPSHLLANFETQMHCLDLMEIFQEITYLI